MPFNQMQIDEDDNVTGGMFAQSPVGQALQMNRDRGWLAGIAKMMQGAILGRGGVGPPQGLGLPKVNTQGMTEGTVQRTSSATPMSKVARSTASRLSPEEEMNLVLQAQEGNTGAKEQLWNAFQGAFRKFSPSRKGGMLPEDRVQEQYMAMEDALKAHDVTKGPFVNTLVNYVIQRLPKAESRQAPGVAVEVPWNKIRAKTALSQAQSRRDVRVNPIDPQASGTKMTPESASIALGRKYSPEQIRDIRGIVNEGGMGTPEVGSLQDMIDAALAGMTRGTGSGFGKMTQAEEGTQRALDVANKSGVGRLFRGGQEVQQTLRSTPKARPGLYKKGMGPGTPLRSPQ